MRCVWLLNLSRSQPHTPTTRLRLQRRLFWLLSLVSLLQCLAPRPLQAQSIITAPDGTQTLVTPNGSQFNISGGQLSPDQLNQFHSFLRFNLNSGEIANFLANPSIQNILARVVGGDPSVINGLIQVSGGNPNLYLINPAGVIFGPTASLNVPAAFTATTANGIQVGSNWFNASGTNDFSTLSGTPNAFAFAMAQPGAIANFGTLSVNSGQSLALLGGTVVSTGTLNAPGGQLLVTSIPGQSLVRLNQPGNLLSLDIQPLGGSSPVTPLPFSPATLPQLLTAGSGGNATGVTVNPNGTVDLTGSGLAIAPGDVVVRNASAQTVTLRANQNLTLVNSQLQSTGDLNLFAQNAVQVRDSVASPFIASSGGQLYLQGNQTVDIFALNHPASGFFSGGNMLLRSASTVGADAHFFSGGNFQIQQLNGQLGGLFSPYDPVIRASGDIAFDSYSGYSLHIIAGGNVTITGSVTISGYSSLNGNYRGAGLVDSVTFSDGTTIAFDSNNQPVLDIRAGTTNFGTPRATGAFPPDTFLPATPNQLNNPATGSNISIGNVSITPANGLVLLTNRYFPNAAFSSGTITAGNITTTPQSVGIAGVVIDASGSVTVGNIDTSIDTGAAGNVTLLSQGSISAGSLTTSAGSGAAGNISLLSQGSISAGSFTTSNGSGNGGNVSAIAPGDITITGTTNTSTNSFGNAGSVLFNSRTGSITAGDIITSASGSSGNGGDVTLLAATAITTNGIDTSASSQGGNAGNVFIDPSGDVQVSFINTESASGNSGNIDVTAGRYFRATGGFSSFLGPTLSLSASGRNPGIITVRHGGNGVNAFVVGNARLNGTAFGVASFSTTTRLNTDFVLPRQSLLLTLLRGRVRIRTGTPQGIDPLLYGRGSGNGEGDGDGTLAIKPACGISGAASGFASAEGKFTSAYEEFLGRAAGGGGRSADNACDTLVNVAQATGVRPALIYVNFVPAGNLANTAKERPKPGEPDAVLWRFTSQGMAIDTVAQNPDKPVPRLDSDQLELVMITTKGIVRKRVPQATRAQVLKLAQQFRSTVTNPQTNDYLAPSQQLYQWIVAPLATELKTEEIDSIAFLMDTGLRSLPIAALHDGKQFIIETYSVGLMPSLSLTDTRFISIRDAEVLAMGASRFQDQAPLPAVPTELATITQTGRNGKAFLNDAFTIGNLKLQRSRDPYRIVHLATHGEFRPGSLKDSYIQFTDGRLGLDRMRLLGLSDPPVELLVLSACRTALGNEEAELGFGGLAVQSGVKSALASLWYVSDEGTLGLMSQFYQDLATSPIKAEALRRTQLAMLKGQIRLEKGRLQIVNGTIPLPPELQNLEAKPLNHPYYWAAFTMIGSPW